MAHGSRSPSFFVVYLCSAPVFVQGPDRLLHNGQEKLNRMATVDKALIVLKQFLSESELGVSDLSRLTGMDKTSVFRALKSLERFQFVEQDPVSRKYRLGFAVVELAGAKLKQLPLTDVARPHLAKLSRDTGETVQMSVMHELRVLYLSIVESSQPIRVSVGVGAYGPLHCTAAGKLLLAHQPRAVQDRVLSQPLQRYTASTVIDPVELRRELKDIRDRGWAIDDEGFVAHLRVAAAPIRNATGDVIAAVAVGGPSIRVDRKCLSGLVHRVVDTAAAISRDLNYAA